MAIKGLTDRPASFPKLGTLRKGAEKPDEKRPGQDLKGFRFDSDDAEACAAFAATYGEEPRQVNVFLPYATVDENFQTWQEEYSAGGLKHRCDGETCVLWQTPNGRYSDEPKPCPGGCKPVGRLMVIIPELQRFAYVTVQTTSINDIKTLQANLEAAAMLRGDLRGIPFVLSRKPREISTPEIVTDRRSPDYGKPTGKRVRREKWLLSIEPASVWVPHQLQVMQRAALTDSAVRALPDGRMVDEDTGEIVDVDVVEDVENDSSLEQLREQWKQARQALRDEGVVVPTVKQSEYDAMTATGFA